MRATVGDGQRDSWYYVIALGNLTKTEIDRAHVSVQYKGTMRDLRIYSDSFADATESRQSTGWVGRHNGDDMVSAYVSRLKPGEGTGVIVMIAAQSQPKPEDLQITIESAAGNFARLAPEVFDRLGWR